jgi:hypothetical protein
VRQCREGASEMVQRAGETGQRASEAAWRDDTERGQARWCREGR